MSAVAVALGVDIGTSGARAAAVDEHGHSVGVAAVRFDTGAQMRDPKAWLQATGQAIAGLGATVDLSRVRHVAVAGTSGSVLAVDRALQPLSAPMMYADPVLDQTVLDRIAAVAPQDSPARGANSALARAIVLSRQSGAAHLLHQSDFVLAHLAGTVLASDETNALKTGYDPVGRCWGRWIAAAGLDLQLLPQVRPAGVPLAGCGTWGRDLGLPRGAVLHAGLTDGCAAFLATGARLAGEGVTSLGSTLVLKLVSEDPIFDTKSGVYSHRVGDVWVAGGASNTGGAVLAELFGRDRLDALDAMVRADRPTGLDYYPLLRPGERFPICDPNLAPRLRPRPEAEGDYYQAVLEGISRIEAQAYRKLAALGAPPLINLRSVGGGARPAGFTAIRQRALDVPFLKPISAEAAVGAARLALWQGVLA
jgi:sugar (pentulose or hexulose) kinase